jgi:hypothetical protein
MGTGDVVEFAGADIPGPEIRWKTGRDTNHTGMIVLMESPYTGVRRRYLHEAVSGGVQGDYLSNVLQNYKGKAYWYPLKNEYRIEIPQIEERAFPPHPASLGTSYDWGGLIKQLKGHQTINLEESDHIVWCAEAVYIWHGAKTGDTAWWPGELEEMVPRWKERIQIL